MERWPTRLARGLACARRASGVSIRSMRIQRTSYAVRERGTTPQSLGTAELRQREGPAMHGHGRSGPERKERNGQRPDGASRISASARQKRKGKTPPTRQELTQNGLAGGVALDEAKTGQAAGQSRATSRFLCLVRRVFSDGGGRGIYSFSPPRRVRTSCSGLVCARRMPRLPSHPPPATRCTWLPFLSFPFLIFPILFRPPFLPCVDSYFPPHTRCRSLSRHSAQPPQNRALTPARCRASTLRRGRGPAS